MSSNIENIMLTMKDLNYYVGGKKNDDKSQRKQILFDINLQFQPDAMVALMGPSGAGKTTLLNVLTGRAGGERTGYVIAGDRRVSPRLLKQYSCYIPQDDLLLGALTPRETLEFTAELRLRQTFSHEKKTVLINAILEEMSLTDCADVQIGNEYFRGISGGQRKRTSIAMELVTRPNLLFVDEPTSGLDSKTSLDVIRLLSGLAHRGRTIIVSIHQPSPRLFNAFDLLLLMDNGRVAFYGTIESSLRYFSSLGVPVPEDENPPNFYLEVLESPPDTIKSFGMVWRERGDGFSPKWVELSQDVLEGAEDEGDRDSVDPKYRTTMAHQFKVLLRRTYKTQFSDPTQLRRRMFATIFNTLLTTTMYWQVENDQKGTRDLIGALFFLVLSMPLQALFRNAITYFVEKNVLLREYQNGSFRLVCYYAAYVVLVLVVQALVCFLAAAVTQSVVGLRKGIDHFVVVWYVSFVSSVGFAGMGYMIGAYMEELPMAVSVVNRVMLPLTIYIGYFISPDGMVNSLKWIYWINPMAYSFAALLVNQFKNTNLNWCYDNDERTNCPYGQGIVRGEIVLARYDAHSDEQTELLLGLTIFPIITLVAGYYVLRYRVRSARV